MPLKNPPERLVAMSLPAKIEIHFITGKGGVGKSTVAAGLALKKSLTGKKTLLVELGHQSFFQDFFNIPSVGYKPLKLRENLDLALWSGQECLHEYALHLLKIESLYRLFFENPVSRALINVAPALPELAILGKVTSGPPRYVGPTLPYDCLVVDAYATGHFLALLRAPKGLAEAVKYGPMGEQSRSIDRVIRDPEVCSYYVVTLPEEMPVLEALELSSSLKQEFEIEAIQILNKTFPTSDDQGSTPFEACLKEMNQRRQQALHLLRGHKTFEVPFEFENRPWKLIEKLAERMSNVPS
jgi:anion-transporting  ArsA/GET3 family ATPase